MPSKGENEEQYYYHIMKALAFMPNFTMDDGADLVGALHMIAFERYEGLHRTVRDWVSEAQGPSEKQKLLDGVMGSSEETTTGVIRLKSMEQEGVLRFPVVAVNDAYTKHMFDNRYGTGQSTIDGIIRATNVSDGRGDFCGFRLRLVRQRRGHEGKRTGGPC